MARIAGVDLPRDKQIVVALTYIYGIGPATSQRLLGMAKIDEKTRTKDLTDQEVSKIRELIDKNYKVEGDLRSEISRNVKRLMDIGSYRGLRHRKRLPCRGQRTHTNARTRKGPRGATIAKKRTV